MIYIEIAVVANNGQDLLYHATRNKQIDHLRQLLLLGAEIMNPTDPENALTYATKKKDKDFVELLCKNKFFQ